MYVNGVRCHPFPLSSESCSTLPPSPSPLLRQLPLLLPPWSSKRSKELNPGEGSLQPRDCWQSLTDTMFLTREGKAFNGMKMSLITGAARHAVQVQGDRCAVVLHLHFHLS